MDKRPKKTVEELSIDEICLRLEKLAQKAKRLSQKYISNEATAEVSLDDDAP